MTEEERNKKQIRFNRWAILIALLLVAGGFVLAILRDSDWWAFGGCAALALVLTIFSGDEKHPGILGKGGLVIGAGAFLFSAMGHPFQQFAEMMSRNSVTSGSSLVWRRTDFRMLS